MSKRKSKHDNEYDSSFDEESEDDEERLEQKRKKVQRQDLANKSPPGPSRGYPAKSEFEEARRRADSYKSAYLSLNAFERHRKLINDYFLYYPGAKNQFSRNSSNDKNDYDIIRDNHKFIWSESDDANTWEKQLSKKYYDKLFKEYCICDLTHFTVGKIAMRWRTETEVVQGKGQFSCGARKCVNSEDMRTWEVNFAYMEESVKKNALVKVRLCPECSVKLNYYHKKKEVTKPKKKKHKKYKCHERSSSSGKHPTTLASLEEVPQNNTSENAADPNSQEGEKSPGSIWKEPLKLPDTKTREEEFDDYLDDLFL